MKIFVIFVIGNFRNFDFKTNLQSYKMRLFRAILNTVCLKTGLKKEYIQNSFLKTIYEFRGGHKSEKKMLYGWLSFSEIFGGRSQFSTKVFMSKKHGHIFLFPLGYILEPHKKRGKRICCEKICLKGDYRFHSFQWWFFPSLSGEGNPGPFHNLLCLFLADANLGNGCHFAV